VYQGERFTTAKRVQAAEFKGNSHHALLPFGLSRQSPNLPEIMTECQNGPEVFPAIAEVHEKRMHGERGRAIGADRSTLIPKGWMLENPQPRPMPLIKAIQGLLIVRAWMFPPALGAVQQPLQR
jgi:hypothetical protein